MKKPWIIFFLCIAAGITLVAAFTIKIERPHDTPTRIPEKNEIVQPGLSTYDITRTSDETKIPQLMYPTPIVKLVTQRLMTIACDDGTDLCKLQAIYDFIRQNYEYQETTLEHSWIQTPGETLLRGSGDGTDLALLLSTMQRAAGFTTEILKSKYNTFVRVQTNNVTIIMDPSCQGCNFMAASVILSGNEKVYS